MSSDYAHRKHAHHPNGGILLERFPHHVGQEPALAYVLIAFARPNRLPIWWKVL
jgi:hypothetical protein